MADFFIYQPIDMLNEEHLGDATSQNQVLYTDTDDIDKKGNQITTKHLSNGLTKITKHHYPRLDTFSMYEYSRELSGRYKVENHKIFYVDWIAIYGGDVFYSDLPQIRYAQVRTV